MAEPDVDALMAQAFDHLDDDEPGKALKIGQRLEAMHFSGGFEIQGLALAVQGRTHEAIEALERGVRVAPDVWLLWQQLGNLRSDTDNYDGAMEAYARAEDLPGADAACLAYNRSQALYRADRPAEADTVLKPFREPGSLDGADDELRLLIWSSLAKISNQHERWAETAAFVEGLAFQPDDSDHEHPMAELEAERAVALLRLRRPDEARAAALRAVGYEKHCETAQWVLRELRLPEDVSRTHYYVLMVEGRWHEPASGDTAPGFYATYHVVADDETEALSFIRDFEPAAVRDTLTIAESEILEGEPQPKGVYVAHPGYSFFAEE